MEVSHCSHLKFYNKRKAYAATTHIVGGDDGWTTGVDYSSWASGRNFTIGDTLLFDYVVRRHAVYEVGVEDYGDCVKAFALNEHKSSPTSIQLSTAGTRYFICPMSDHCIRGLKLEVTVMAGSTTSGDAPPPSSTDAPAPAPSPTS